MDARTYFLMLYRAAHGDTPGTARRILNDPTPEQMRITLPGHNSLAWIIWHIARSEDWAVNTMLRGEEQVLTRGDWRAKLGIARRDFGSGMTAAEVADLSARIDLGALRGYFDAVTAETRRFVDTFDFDTLEDPLDVPGRLALAPEVCAPWSDALRDLVERQTTNRWFLNVALAACICISAKPPMCCRWSRRSGSSSDTQSRTRTRQVLCRRRGYPPGGRPSPAHFP